MVHLLNKIMQALGRLSTLHWFLIMIIIWMLIYAIYVQFMKRYLRTMDLPYKLRKHLIEIIFRLCLIGTSVPFILSRVSASLLDVLMISPNWTSELGDQLSICKIREEMHQPGVKPLFVILSSFSVLDTLDTGFNKGWKNLDFLQKQLVLAIFFITYFSKCPLLGLTLYLLVIRSSLPELYAQLFVLIESLSKSSWYGKTSKIFIVYHLVLWIETFIITLPLFLATNKTITSSMMNAELKTLIVMDFLLWLFVIVFTLNSVLGRIVLSFVMPSESWHFSVMYWLFGGSIRPEEIRIGNPNDRKPDRTVNQMKMLLQTVRCLIVIRRKLRHRREEKELEAANQNRDVGGGDVAQSHSDQLRQRGVSTVPVQVEA